jgi:N-methylhydantoinase A/oxoprolinase/acetone carboxylase beta subunit
MRVGSDTGGTFTDLVDEHGGIAKVLSTPEDPSRALRDGLTHLEGGVDLLAHGTTVATNALLERNGALTALVTTAGIADVIEIGRQDRPSLYDPTVDRPEPIVPRELRFEVTERLDADGSVLVPLDLATLPDLSGCEPSPRAVAVVLLHSDVAPTHERAVAAALRERYPHLEVSASCEVSPEYREYERTVTTAVNASLRPTCRRYLGALRELAPTVLVLTSEGGLVALDRSLDTPARLLLSGPAGGVRAAAAVAAANGCADAISFDMGGTSTDVCLITGGRPEPASERTVAGLPIRLPSLDVHTIGAGGGSIAALDAGGALIVGPRSAGAVPGPACYGRGGSAPTVTDANLVAGRIDRDSTFPELGELDSTAAAGALARAGLSAEGVLAVVNANMVRALRHVSIERGVDPRGLALVAFGGAGPLHACDLAAELGIETVIVPARAGVFSAVGVLCSPRQREVVRSWATPLDDAEIATVLDTLAKEAAADLGGDDVEVEVSLDCRYAGQSHELRVPTVAAFPSEHRRRNGYDRPDTPIEVTALRAAARRAAPLDLLSLPVAARSGGTGPMVVAEADCTIWIPLGWSARPGEAGALVLRRSAA